MQDRKDVRIAVQKSVYISDCSAAAFNTAVGTDVLQTFRLPASTPAGGPWRGSQSALNWAFRTSRCAKKTIVPAV
jgi:hypothetical protein